MSKQREGGVQLKTMPTTNYDRHFLPTLNPFNSIPCVSQICDPVDTFDTLRQRENEVSSKYSQNQDGVASEPKKTPIQFEERRDDTGNATNASHSKSPQAEGILPAATSNPAFLNSDSSDRRKNRKTQARRYLVEGLSSKDSNRRGLYRSHTFNINEITGTHGSQRSPNTRQSPKSKPEVTNVQKHNKRIRFEKNSLPGTGVESQEKTKAAIEKWNELILELNSHQFEHKSKPNHLSVLSDSSSDDLFPPPTYGKMPKSTGPSHSHSVSIISNSKFTGLGFTRYRPITPNLLDKLDKLKVSSRKRTQRWINQIQVQRRSYNVPSKMMEVTKTCADQTPVTGDDGCVTSHMDTLKPLKRTDSYGSSATRHSSFVQAKKSQAEFL